MATAITGLRRAPSSAGEGTTFDGSRAQFRVGGANKVSELLHALSFVKASPALGTGPSSTALPFVLGTTIQRLLDPPSQPPAYNNLFPPTTTVGAALDSNAFSMARIAMLTETLKIDSAVTPMGTAQNPSDWLVQSAAFSVVRALDYAIAQGTGGETPVPYFPGLSALSAGRSSTEGALGSTFERAVRNLIVQITPNGGGAGEGVHCLIGGPTVLRMLMATNTGQSGTSGWRTDPRTGLLVYHYMGIPFYRTEVPVSGDPTATSLYAANLGETGLQLVHAYGTAESFGVEADELPITASTASRAYTVHGAWALQLWEREAIYEMKEIVVTASNV